MEGKNYADLTIYFYGYTYYMKIEDKQRTLFTRQQKLRSNPTKAEQHFITLLDKANINYIFQKAFIAGKNYVIVDFYLPKPNRICIEIDGEYHNTEKQKRKDYCNTTYLTKTRGFKVIRYSNEEVLNMDCFSLENV